MGPAVIADSGRVCKLLPMNNHSSRYPPIHCIFSISRRECVLCEDKTKAKTQIICQSKIHFIFAVKLCWLDVNIHHGREDKPPPSSRKKGIMTHFIIGINQVTSWSPRHIFISGCFCNWLGHITLLSQTINSLHNWDKEDLTSSGFLLFT